VFYRSHPDYRLEKLFFALLRECVEQGSINTSMLRRAIHKSHLRKDALALLGL
jgi:predicted DNA-binding ribbon-helix-helix protein